VAVAEIQGVIVYQVRSGKIAEKRTSSHNLFSVSFCEQALKDPETGYFTLAFMCNYTNQWQQMSAYTDSMFVEIDRLQQPGLDERRWNLYYFWAYELRVQHYAGLNQPEQALQEIRQAEAIYDPRWNEEDISNAYILDGMYGVYYFIVGDYIRNASA